MIVKAGDGQLGNIKSKPKPYESKAPTINYWFGRFCVVRLSSRRPDSPEKW